MSGFLGRGCDLEGDEDAKKERERGRQRESRWLDKAGK